MDKHQSSNKPAQDEEAEINLSNKCEEFHPVSQPTSTESILSNDFSSCDSNTKVSEDLKQELSTNSDDSQLSTKPSSIDSFPKMDIDPINTQPLNSNEPSAVDNLREVLKITTTEEVILFTRIPVTTSPRPNNLTSSPRSGDNTAESSNSNELSLFALTTNEVETPKCEASIRFGRIFIPSLPTIYEEEDCCGSNLALHRKEGKHTFDKWPLVPKLDLSFLYEDETDEEVIKLPNEPNDELSLIIEEDEILAIVPSLDLSFLNDDSDGPSECLPSTSSTRRDFYFERSEDDKSIDFEELEATYRNVLVTNSTLNAAAPEFTPEFMTIANNSTLDPLATEFNPTQPQRICKIGSSLDPEAPEFYPK